MILIDRKVFFFKFYLIQCLLLTKENEKGADKDKKDDKDSQEKDNKDDKDTKKEDESKKKEEEEEARKAEVEEELVGSMDWRVCGIKMSDGSKSLKLGGTFLRRSPRIVDLECRLIKS